MSDADGVNRPIETALRPWSGLSCYTSALHGYLNAEWDASDVIARSVSLRIAPVENGLLAFSHHSPSIDRLPDGSSLQYEPLSSMRELREEVSERGRALVVADTAALPWSVGYRLEPRTHWLLLTESLNEQWFVQDLFEASLPGLGQQKPYEGWVHSNVLLEAMQRNITVSPVQALRDEMAFGAAVRLPDHGAVWMRRVDDDAESPAANGHGFDDTSVAHSLALLLEELARPGFDPFVYLEDMWATAGHQLFLNRFLKQRYPCVDATAVDTKIADWSALPRVMRIAYESALRGRHRIGLLESALRKIVEDLG